MFEIMSLELGVSDILDWLVLFMLFSSNMTPVVICSKNII